MEDCEIFRKRLGLSMQDFAHLFDVSLSILLKIKAGKANGNTILKRIEIYANCPEALKFALKLNGKWLHTKKSAKIWEIM